MHEGMGYIRLTDSADGELNGLLKIPEVVYDYVTYRIEGNNREHAAPGRRSHSDPTGSAYLHAPPDASLYYSAAAAPPARMGQPAPRANYDPFYAAHQAQVYSHPAPSGPPARARAPYYAPHPAREHPRAGHPIPAAYAQPAYASPQPGYPARGQRAAAPPAPPAPVYLSPETIAVQQTIAQKQIQEQLSRQGAKRASPPSVGKSSTPLSTSLQSESTDKWFLDHQDYSSTRDKSSPLQPLDRDSARSRRTSEDVSNGRAAPSEADLIHDQISFIKQLSSIPNTSGFYNVTNENEMNTDEMIQLLARLHTSSENSADVTGGGFAYSLSNTTAPADPLDASPYADFFHQLRDV